MKTMFALILVLVTALPATAAEPRTGPVLTPDRRPAPAAIGCTPSRTSPDGLVCARVIDTYHVVHDVRVSRSIYGLPNAGPQGNICGYRATAAFLYPSGRMDRIGRERRFFHPGCTAFAAFVELPWGYFVPRGTVICASWWEDGRARGSWKRRRGNLAGVVCNPM